ncbi:hypothetical protein R1flu_010012 [Riccia fluitans]|uniref:Uncharacterized protein n=1 Tax=Riccia fluitans TaxID=41844 RepID=A0ABD1Z4K3_9MARC
MAGYTEVDLLLRLGIKWGSYSGGLGVGNISNGLENTQVIGQGLPLEQQQLESHSSDFEELAPTTQPDSNHAQPTEVTDGSFSLTKTYKFADFQKLIADLFVQVCFSKCLISQTYLNIQEACNHSLNLKARMGPWEGEECLRRSPEEIRRIPEADGSLLRRRDFGTLS